MFSRIIKKDIMRIWILPILLCSLSGCTYYLSDIVPQNIYTKYYDKLQSMFPKEQQGFGFDFFDRGISFDSAMTYGLLLSAESIKYKYDQSNESKERIEAAVSWLVANKQGNDGTPGWGHPIAWDAFGDGSINPAYQVYTITTAIAIEGLLDALQLSEMFSYAEKVDILNIIEDVFNKFLTSTWTYYDSNSGYFWYSTSRDDDYFTPNVSSAFLGVLSRFYFEYGEFIHEKYFYQDRINEAARAINNSAQLRNGAPFWKYYAGVETPNDLVHHCYTLWGLETYRYYVNEIQLRWSRDDSIRSLQCFWKSDIIHYFPQDVKYEGVNEQFNTRPADLWGVGMMMGLFAKWDMLSEAKKVFEAIIGNYGDWPHLTVYPIEFVNDSNFYPRHVSHVLWGLSNYIYFKKPFDNLSR